MIIGKITPAKKVYELPSVAKLVLYNNINEYFLSLSELKYGS